MARLRDRRPHRDEQCPKRGPGLYHAQDGTPECVFCHEQTRSDGAVGNVSEPAVATPAESSLERISADEIELNRIVFTTSEHHKLEFLRWLHGQGRV